MAINPDTGEEEEETPPVFFPERLSAPTIHACVIGLLTWMLDIAMLVVSIAAWVGAKKPKDDETDPLKMTWITWTPLARKVQPAEIAIAGLGLIWNNVNFSTRRKGIGSLYGQFNAANASRIRWSYLRIRLPADVIMVLTWVLLTVYQAQYVPLLGRSDLAECTMPGKKLSQCKQVNGTWICAIIYW